jgi:hypothetical protein
MYRTAKIYFLEEDKYFSSISISDQWDFPKGLKLML